MKFGFKHVAVAVVLAFGAISTAPATVQAQQIDAAEVEGAVATALQAADPLAALETLMAANPTLAAVISGSAVRTNSSLAAGLATRLATVVANSSLSPADKAAQIQSGAQSLAAANPGAAVAIFNNMAGAAPDLAGSAAAGAQAGAPTQTAAITSALQIVVDTAGGGTTGGGTNTGVGNNDGGGDDDDPPGSPV